ncbi:MAG: response regulator [Gammaproteobacteria bacterium]|nr:response regulator [Gammaproteobacteria bacterium]
MFEQTRYSVLVVDDTPENIDIMAGILKNTYDVRAAPNATVALKIVQSSSPPDVILLDVMMPEMDGFELCKILKSDVKTQRIPVIFVTANTSKESVSKGIELGAYYYLSKPVSPSVVMAIVAAALSQLSEYKILQEEVQKAANTMRLLKNGCFQFRTIEEARSLALILAKMASDPVRLVSGLTELMINAVEHGNLGITYDEKGKLNEQRQWRQEVERRLSLTENRDKLAYIYIEQNDTEIRFRIIDQGSGFEWQSYLEIDPERADHTHGRGIAMSRMLSFSSVEFQGAGNEVIATYSL